MDSASVVPSRVRVRSGQPEIMSAGVLSSYVTWLSSSSGTAEELFCFRRMGSCADGPSEQTADGEEHSDVQKLTDSMPSGDVEREDNTGSESHISSCVDRWIETMTTSLIDRWMDVAFIVNERGCYL